MDEVITRFPRSLEVRRRPTQSAMAFVFARVNLSVPAVGDGSRSELCRMDDRVATGDVMEKKSTLKKRVVKNSARTGKFSHKAARVAAKKAAAKRNSSRSKA